MQSTEAWQILACRGAVRDNIGKEGMGQVVRQGIFKNLLFVLFKTIHAYNLRRQVFEHILLHYTCTKVCPTLRSSCRESLFYFDTCNFKEFYFIPYLIRNS